MNKLDEISAQSRGKRILVRTVKIAIAGCSAICMIAIGAQIRTNGITLANEVTVETQTAYIDTVGSRTVLSMSDKGDTIAPLDENGEKKNPEQKPIDVPKHEDPKPSLRPDGWKGNAASYDENGDLSIYGKEVTEKKGQIKDTISNKTGGALESRRAVGNEYFDDALFIGNSLVVGMEKRGPLTNADYYASIGLNVKTFFSKAAFPDPLGVDGNVSAIEAYIRKEGYNKVYLMFGINELGWPSLNTFISYYSYIIDSLLSVKEDTVIYVQGIMPICESVYRNTKGAQEAINNGRIAEFNAAILKMAEEKGVYYLDPGSALCDENGNLFAAATSDGIHLNASYLNKWASYLKSRTVQ